MLLLHLFPEGVEELDGAFAVYADEPPIGFDVLEVDDVREGWEDSWREFHHGVAVGRFWVGPPWEDPPPELEPIVVDPGRAFGTGAHATTRLQPRAAAGASSRGRSSTSAAGPACSRSARPSSGSPP